MGYLSKKVNYTGMKKTNIILSISIVVVILTSIMAVVAIQNPNIFNKEQESTQVTQLSQGSTLGMSIQTIESDKSKQDDDEKTTPTVRESNWISEQQAKEVALNAVNGKITDIEVEKINKIIVYSVEIDANGDEIDVKIEVLTGKILKIERDSEDEEDEEDDNDENEVEYSEDVD